MHTAYTMLTIFKTSALRSASASLHLLGSPTCISKKTSPYLRSLYSRKMSAPAAVASSQNVTIPALPELYDANFLDRLVPKIKSTSEATESSQDVQTVNPMMEALKGSTHRTHTTNSAQTYDSTSSATLDAFHMLRPFTSGSDIYSCLDKSWKEDPGMTLRVIWNLRSIHDGKGEKELFYQYALSLYVSCGNSLTVIFLQGRGAGFTRTIHELL